MNQLISSKEMTMGTREIAEMLGKDHSNIKISAKRRLGREFCKSRESHFLHNGNVYAEYILTIPEAEELTRQISVRSRATNSLESVALTTIEQVLGVTLIRQFRVGKYRIDGYDAENNIAYEIDEQHHCSQSEQDKQRQEFIERELGCQFKRVNI